MALEVAKRLLAQRVHGGGFDRLLDKVRIVEAGGGALEAEMKVEESHCAPQRRFMHGAMSTLLVDSLSGIAMMTAKPEFQNSGVSLNINMTYMKAAELGQEILIRAKTDKLGSKVAFLSVEILNKATKDVLATGSHVKFVEHAIPKKS